MTRYEVGGSDEGGDWGQRGRPIKTNGIGQKTTNHLNLTVSMADGMPKPVGAQTKPKKKRRPPYAHKIGYAGREY